MTDEYEQTGPTPEELELFETQKAKIEELKVQLGKIIQEYAEVYASVQIDEDAAYVVGWSIAYEITSIDMAQHKAWVRDMIWPDGQSLSMSKGLFGAGYENT